MRKIWFFLFLLPLLILTAPFAPAQQPGQQTVTLGNSTVPLTGPWKFHIGDNPAWSDVNFDDSGWGTMDLTPPAGSYDPTFGTSGFVPGWTTRGYKGYSGYAWYRLQVNIQDNQTALALKMPGSFGDAYQVYVNGTMIGEFGRFTPKGVTSYVNQPRAFPLPANFRSGPATIAIRMWTVKYKAWLAQDTGGLHGPPVLGRASAIAELLNLDWYGIDRLQYFYFLVIAILLLALGVAFALFRLDSTEPAYLWLGLVCVDFLAVRVLHTVVNCTTWLSQDTYSFLLAIAMSPYTGLWVLFWAYWFRLRRMRLVHGAAWTLIAVAAVYGLMLKTSLYGTVVPIQAVVWLVRLWFVRNFLMGALFAWVINRGIRKNRFEGWLAAPAVALVILALYAFALGITGNLFAFGILIFPADVALILSLLIVTVLLLRRFLRAQRDREQWRLEIEQARQVQQMLIPEALPVVPGFTLESEYRPAQQVGGDFFQIIEGTDNSVLVVVGDVSGKGLKAAMLVSLIVGTIRTLARYTRDPMEVLRGLNERLCGRMQGHFATCIVARIASNGETILANAGHIPPYLNGAEVAIAGSLPLGMIEAAEFEQAHLTLQPGDRITFLTDGIVEAQNEKKELFGFERTHQISQQPAAVIAETAQRFGQDDDITVIGIVRTA